MSSRKVFYTVGINNIEYMLGLFETLGEARDAQRKELVKYGALTEEEVKALSEDELWDWADGYGIGYIEVHLTADNVSEGVKDWITENR